MKIFAFCPGCQIELGHPSFEPFFVPYYEDRIAQLTCSLGHKSELILQSQKFEVLLESGANAFDAGFTLEACTSFSAALERMYEFAIRVLATHLGMSETLLENVFKGMARQSERQLGAFHFLYSLQFETNYAPDKSIVETRNAVVHKGHIPTPDEAHAFCSKVYTEILNVTEKLQGNLQQALDQVITLDLQKRYARSNANMHKASTTGTTFFSLSDASHKRTFDEALLALQHSNALLTSSFPHFKDLNRSLRDILKLNEKPDSIPSIKP